MQRETFLALIRHAEQRRKFAAISRDWKLVLVLMNEINDLETAFHAGHIAQCVACEKPLEVDSHGPIDGVPTLTCKHCGARVLGASETQSAEEILELEQQQPTTKE